MHRTFRYPLHPTPAQEEALYAWLAVCCDLYNAALQERRDGWRRGLRIGYHGQTESLTEIRRLDPEMALMPVDAQRSALVRLDRAFVAFFRRCKDGERPGYPRFRTKRQYDSFSFGARVHALLAGAGRSAHLAVPKLGDVRMHLYRPLRGDPLEVTIRRDPCGKWWACIACDLGEAPPKTEPTRTVGVDVGLRSLAALSTGEIIENPRHVEHAAKPLATRQRAMARKCNGSASRKRAVRLVAKAHAHVRNQRLDHARKVARDIVRRFDLIAHEDLNIAGMAKGWFGGPINNAAWRVLLRAIACKAEEAGKTVVAVDPRGTSQECSGCGTTVHKTLAERVHRCACGLTLDRDVNAARNILARAIAPGTGAVSPPRQKTRVKARRHLIKRSSISAEYLAM